VSRETEYVAGVFPAASMSDVLPVVHRRGFGHLARVTRVENDRALGEIERLRAPAPIAEAVAGRTDRAVLVIEAPRRVSEVVSLMQGLGAVAIASFAAQAPTSTVLAFDPATLGTRSRRRSSSR
jgi:hypothetical protein